MNCPRCACPNEADARFCKNCGTPMYYYPPVNNPAMPPQSYAAFPQQATDPTIRYFIILLSYDLLRSIWWLVFTRFIIPVVTSSEHFDRISTLYSISNWLTSGTAFVLTFIFAGLCKNRAAKIFLFCYGGLSLLIFLVMMYMKG